MILKIIIAIIIDKAAFIDEMYKLFNVSKKLAWISIFNKKAFFIKFFDTYSPMYVNDPHIIPTITCIVLAKFFFAILAHIKAIRNLKININGASDI